MTVEEKVYAVLSAATDVTALTTAARIKPPGDWQSLDTPYIMHFAISAESNQTHDQGLANLKTWRYQVSCFADSYANARTLANAVRAALGSYRSGGIVSHWLTDHFVPYEPNVRVAQIACEFQIADML